MAWGILALIICMCLHFMDGSASCELLLLLQALSKTACHLYLILRKLRHLFRMCLCFDTHVPSRNATFSMLILLETICNLCQLVGDVLRFLGGLVKALCCTFLFGLCVIVSILRSIQEAVICNTKDGNAILELRLLFHSLTKAACHMYLALLPLRRAVLHLVKSVKHFVDPETPPTKKGSLHFLEGLCVVFETIPDLLGAGLGLCAALCHGLQGTLFLLASTLRALQLNLFAQVNGEKDRWEKERNRAKEEEKRQNQKVVEYMTVFCQDPVTSLRLKVDVNR